MQVSVDFTKEMIDKTMEVVNDTGHTMEELFDLANINASTWYGNIKSKGICSKSVLDKIDCALDKMLKAPRKRKVLLTDLQVNVHKSQDCYQEENVCIKDP